MKKLLLILLCLPMIGFGQNVYIPDANFKACLVGNSAINTNLDTEIQLSEAATFSGSISVSTNLVVSDLTGLEEFIALTVLSIEEIYITNLDVSNNLALTVLTCYGNSLTNIDLSNNAALTHLDVSYGLLSSIDVSGATALTSLNCSSNQLTSLDVSTNTTLTSLNCSSNQLTSLDVSTNTALTSLNCSSNQLTSLDVSTNTTLTSLNCSSNQLTSLDVSTNTALTSLNCSSNQLTSLDLRNFILSNVTISTGGNSLLFCIDVDNPLQAAFFTSTDPWTSFDTNCVTALGCTDTLAYNYDSTATINDGSCYYGKTYVPDDNFEAYLEANGMGDGILFNDSVLTGNINTVTQLQVYNLSISNLTGIEDFTALSELDCYVNQLTTLDVSNNTALTYLDCGSNQLTSLDVSNNIALNILGCYSNQLTTLDVSNNTALTYLSCEFNQLTSIDLRNHTLSGLALLTSNNLELFCIDVDNPQLAQAVFFGNIDSWTSFDTNCVTALGCADTLAFNYDSTATVNDGSCYYGKTYVPDDNFENYLEAFGMGDGIMLNDSVLTVNINTVTNLNVDNLNISDLTGIEDFTALTTLDCTNNQLTSLDVSQNTALTYLNCYTNGITSLDLSNNFALTSLLCSYNSLTSLDLSLNTALSSLLCFDNQLTSLDLSNQTLQNLSFNTQANPNLLCIDVDNPILAQVLFTTNIDPWTSFDTNCVTALGCADTLAYNYDSTATINDGSCYYGKTYVPDDNFEAYLEANGMGDGIMLNDSVLTGNINTVTTLNVDNQNISDLTGIEDFTALTDLRCEGNLLTNIDVSGAINLTTLYCSNNYITSLNVSGAINLSVLGFYGNQLTSLDVSNNLALTFLDFNDNQITSIDVSQNTALNNLEAGGNQLSNLDVSQNTALTNLWCVDNQITSLDLRNHTLQNLSIHTYNNPNLLCIDVDNPTLVQTLFNNIDSWTSFDTNCVTALGCTDSTACNYIPNATVNDGSCLILYGCTDSLACNYNSTAQCDDGSCLILYGCTDSLACNYNSTAQCDDGGCTYLTVSLNNSQVICSNFSDATLTVNYNTGSYTYLWSNGETTQSIDSLPMGSYSVVVTDSSGCSATLNANVTLATSPAINMFPEICYVTVDSTTGNNKVVVKPMANLLTSKFIIYKESSANIYSPIDTVNYNTLEYVDTASNPMTQSYRYKVSVLDTCSNESIKSDFHKTIHLTLSLGINGEINLIWNAYSGYQPSDYLIFRSINNGAMNQIGVLPGTNLAFTDLTPPSGILNYQVRAIAPNCNIIPFAKNSTNMLVSNVINHSTTAVNELVNSKKVIKITDLLGRETKQTNQPLFYIYDDGTVEKRIVIE
jgi:Leucine-rich repeat (LRR) protein